MAKVDRAYHKLLYKILREGYTYDDPNRKGVKRIEIPSHTFKHSFEDGFPAITTKELKYNNVATELIWFLQGQTNIKYLLDNKCPIWNKDAYGFYLKNNPDEPVFNLKSFVGSIKDYNPDIVSYQLGDLGPVYGHQWRNFNGVDQFENLIKGLIEKPMGTEHIVNSWNASDLPHMALPPCHYGYQVMVKPMQYRFSAGPFENIAAEMERRRALPQYGFELHWNQRSVDSFLGLPYNIASYATLAKVIERFTGYKALGIQGDLKKVHLYDNSIEAVNEQLRHSITTHHECDLAMEDIVEYDRYRLGQCSLDNLLSNLEPAHFQLVDYTSYPAINVPMLSREE